MFVAKRVDGLENEGRDESAEERSPECLEWEIVTDFLQGEEDSADRGSKGHADTGCGCC